MTATLPIWHIQRPGFCGTLQDRVEVAVIGGGITGVSVMAWLARRGVQALLLERDQLATGASGRNAGFLLHGTAANYAMAVHDLGRETAREVWAFTAENHELLLELIAPHPTGHARRGSWTIATSPSEAQWLRESETLLREDGVDATWHDTPPHAPPLHQGGLLVAADGEIDPFAAVHAIAAQAPADVICERAEVTALEPSSSGVRLHLADGAEILAHTVVLATNAHAPQLAPGLGISPVRAQMLATSPNPTTVADRPTYAHRGFQYWRQLDDGRVLVGGFRDRALAEEVGYDLTPTAAIQEHLDHHARALGVTAPVTHRWAGTMGFTADALPLVGELPGHPRLCICAGYSGHGMGFAVNAARHLIDQLVDGTPLPPWLDVRRTTAAV